MALTNFPANFPVGPMVDPNTGMLSPGPDGMFFLLALFNRTGGPSGGITATQARTSANGLTIGALRNQAKPPSDDNERTVAQGLTIGMLKKRGLA